MFENIIGNDKIKESLENIIKSGNISHSYIFWGPEGIGKSIFAKEFAKTILCLNEGIEACGRCKSCIGFEGSNNPDYFEIEPDGNSIKIEQIRNMNKTVLEKPIGLKRKVYIINDSELMTKEAQNSLLKTLEEPPEYVCIILISSNDNMLLNTIKSRCVKIGFNKLTSEELKSVLQNISAEGISDNLIKIADGSIKRAMELEKKEDIYIKINNIFNNLENTNIIDVINSKDEIFKDKEEVESILEYINLILFDLLNREIDNKYISTKTLRRFLKDCY